ncbi:penicillin-binding protein 2 [Halobacteriovorax sp. HLS]|uniref:penicillin-binding protein 2 n=1 Tax=Halobacteriovorax sp. HLS TaxID=2234000 RepID=UPI000FDAF0E0|nr:penicillin-binding protein 2 [Halobacteriovorax sp. HLS]
MFGEDDIVRSHKGRADLIFNIVLACFLIILIRLWYLQIHKGDEFYKYSVQNRLRKEVVKAPRGMIFSRNNKLLVHNTPRFDAIIVPQYLTNKKQTLKKLSLILNMSEKSILNVLRKNSYQARYRPIIIKKNISRKEVAIIETENSKMPGVSVQTFISREYSEKEVGSHALGYISEISQQQIPTYRERDNFNYRIGDFIGQAGIEKNLDLNLRGTDGYQFMEVDARGRMKRLIKGKNLFAGIENKSAIPGDNIRLTIDRDMQRTAYNSLEGKVGSVVAVDVNSGEILAMISRPSFDPSEFSKGLTAKYWKKLSNDEFKPMTDRTIQEHYSPGSTFKTFTALAALEEGIVTANQEISCPPTFRLGRRVYHDWKRGGHGLTDVYKSLRRSVDVYFYKIATKLDIDILSGYAKQFGFGTKTGIALPREIPGLIPTKEWKLKKDGIPWQKGETVSCVIGQSYVLATPLQLALAYASIANGGKLYRPYLIKEIFSSDGTILEKFEPHIVSESTIKKENLEHVKKGLYQVVNHPKGTAWWHRGRGIRMAGKTGTSQVRSMSKKELFSKCKDMPYKDRHHGIFVGFAPFDNPKIAVAAVVEHGCSGSGAAAPVVKNVVTTFMKKYEKKLFEKYEQEDKAYALKLYLEDKKRREKLKAEAATDEEASDDED